MMEQINSAPAHLHICTSTYQLLPLCVLSFTCIFMIVPYISLHHQFHICSDVREVVNAD